MEDTQTSGGIELMYLSRVKYEIDIIITTNLDGTATSSFTWFGLLQTQNITLRFPVRLLQ